MKDTNRTTSDHSGEGALSIQLPEDEPLITDQAAVVLLRLIRHVQPKHIDANDQGEKL